MNATTPATLLPVAVDIASRKLGAARELIRSAGIHDDASLMTALQNILAACSFKNGHTLALDDLICDIEGPVHYPEPELSGVDKRGEYDGYTQRRV